MGPDVKCYHVPMARRLNPNQFSNIEDVPTSSLVVGDRLMGLFGKSYPVLGLQPKGDKMTTVTAEHGTYTARNNLTHTIVKRQS